MWIIELRLGLTERKMEEFALGRRADKAEQSWTFASKVLSRAS
jgi:hypothetical protein